MRMFSALIALLVLALFTGDVRAQCAGGQCAVPQASAGYQFSATAVSAWSHPVHYQAYAPAAPLAAGHTVSTTVESYHAVAAPRRGPVRGLIGRVFGGRCR